MAAYLIYRASISDFERYRQNYMSQTGAIIASFGGEFLVRGGDKKTLEGAEETRRVVLIRFPSMEVAERFYYSEDYQRVIKERLNIAEAEMVLVEGV